MVNLGTLVMECGIVPALLMVATNEYKYFVASVLGIFHVGISLSVGIDFTEQLFVILMVLLPSNGLFSPENESHVDGTFDTFHELLGSAGMDHLPAAVLTFVGLPWAVLNQLEGWPLTSMSIFPFNADQIKAMQVALSQGNLKFIILDADVTEKTLWLSSDELAARDVLSLATSMEAGLPSVYTPGFHSAVTWEMMPGLASGGADAILDAANRLQKWMESDAPYRSAKTGTVVKHVRAARLIPGPENGCGHASKRVRLQLV